MRKAGPRKYEPLRAFLAAQPPAVSEVTLTFAELAALLGAPLPRSAWGTAFWTNRRDLFHAPSRARAWHGAGWRVRAARPGVSVTFARAEVA